MSQTEGTETSQEIFQRTGEPLPSLVPLFIAALGNLFEFYDFSVMAIFSSQLASSFLPFVPKLQGTAYMLLIYSMSYFSRPFGALFYGYMGDRYGRRYALQISIISMAIPTFLVGCLPPYNVFGIGSVALLVILRLIQGMSAGGEIGDGVIYGMEYVGLEYVTLSSAIFWCAAMHGVIPSVFRSVLDSFLNTKQMNSWGWRIPFLAVLPFMLCALTCRRVLPETEVFNELADDDSVLDNPVSQVIWASKLHATVIVLASAGMAVTLYLPTTWLPLYEYSLKQPPVKLAFLFNAVGFIVLCFGGFCGFVLTRYYEIPKLAMITNVLNIFIQPACLCAIAETNSVPVIAFLQFVLAFLAGLYPPLVWSFILLTLDDPRVRVTLFSFSWNMSTLIFSCSIVMSATFIYAAGGMVAVAMFCQGAFVISTAGIYVLMNRDWYSDEYEKV